MAQWLPFPVFRRLFLAPPAGVDPAVPLVARFVSSVVAVLVLAAVFTVAFLQLEMAWFWDPIWKYREKFLQGFGMTIVISLVSLVISLASGVFFALLGRSEFLPLRYLTKIYVEFVRGTPLLSQIFLFYFVVTPAMGITDRYVVGIVTLSFFTGAYIAEIVRAGIESIGKSQLESARAIGLTTVQTYRFVIFPQALRQSLPPLAGQFVSLIKDSSLLSVISVNEFAKNAQEISSITYSTLECYLLLAVGYLFLTLPISMWTRWLEGRAKFDT